jgi:hypothetical protein
MANKKRMKEMKKRDFIAREVYKKKGLSKKLAPTGYEAFRVSPRTTLKFGKKYKRIYGATVEPDFRRKIGKNKYGADVKWYPHGYTLPSVKSGTRTLRDIKRYYPIDVKEARRKLMMKKRKPRKR